MNSKIRSKLTSRNMTAQQARKHHNWEEKFRKALLNGAYTVEELAAKYELTRAQVTDHIKDLQKSGTYITEYDGRWTIDRYRAVSNENDWKFRGKAIRSTGRTYFKFGLTADNHYGSKHAREDVTNELYDWFQQENIETVFNFGNWIEGIARFNKTDLIDTCHSWDGQLEYFIDNYPERKGIKTYYVVGDDHEGWCTDSETKIFTKDGWKYFTDLADDETVATSIPGSNYFEWQKVTRVINKQYNGNLIRFTDRSFDFSVTPDHRFEVWRKSSMHATPKKCIMTAQEIMDEYKPRCIGIIRAASGFDGKVPPPIRLEDPDWLEDRDSRRYKHYYDDAFDPYDMAMLCAWFATEGTMNKDDQSSKVSISQQEDVHPEHYAEIKNLIEKMGFNYTVGKLKKTKHTDGPVNNSFNIHSIQLAEYMRKHCGFGCANIKLPDWVLDLPTEYLSDVFDVLIKGDGHERKQGWRYYSASRKLLDQVTEIAQKLGYAVTEIDHDLSDDPDYYLEWKTLSISGCRSIAYLFRQPEEEPYEGTVHCVSVPNERIYLSKHGKSFWTMNCTSLGIDIGAKLENLAMKSGRTDLVNLGYKEAYVALENHKTKERAHFLIDHPGGGSSAQSVSYAAQKLVRNSQHAELPDIWGFGHWHKQGYFMDKGVHIILVPCAKDLDTFGRKKGLNYCIGGAIVEIEVDTDGSVYKLTPQFRMWEDRGFHNQQFNANGPVAKREIR